jgi:hypothetical protein
MKRHEVPDVRLVFNHEHSCSGLGR